MKAPKINLKEMEKLKRQNSRDRLKFIVEYAQWEE